MLQHDLSKRVQGVRYRYLRICQNRLGRHPGYRPAGKSDACVKDLFEKSGGVAKCRSAALELKKKCWQWKPGTRWLDLAQKKETP